MALKDLVASSSTLTEEMVEAIIGAFVRYDIDETEIVLLPEFNDLTNSHKILVFLSALQGWRFVTDGEQAASMKPGEIESKTGIPGGSLRPVLRNLAQQKLLGDKEGIRNFHSSDETRVAEAMASLMNVQFPLLETLGGETVVTTIVPVGVEVLLLVGQQGAAATRKSIGTASKYAAPRVTEAIKKHEGSRHLHKSADGVFHLTTPGQKHLMSELARHSK